MGTETIETSFLSIFALLSFFIFLVVSKYSYKIKSGILQDEDLNKPQAFHKLPVSRSGGLAAIFSLILFCNILFTLFKNFIRIYISKSFYVFSRLFRRS